MTLNVRYIPRGTIDVGADLLNDFAQGTFASGLDTITISGRLGVFSGLVVNGVLSGVVISYSGIEAEIISGLQGSFGSGLQTQAYSGNTADLSGATIDIISGMQVNLASGIVVGVHSGTSITLTSGILGSSSVMSGVITIAAGDSNFTITHSGSNIIFTDGTLTRVIGRGGTPTVSISVGNSTWDAINNAFSNTSDNFGSFGTTTSRIKDIFMLGNISGANIIQASGLAINNVVSGARAAFTSGYMTLLETPTASTLGSGFWTVAITSAAGVPRVFMNFSGVIFSVALA